MVTAQDVFPQPFLWQAAGAFDLPTIWSTVERHRPSDLPVSTSLFVTICFEETACCNIVQGQTPAAMGPGQFQISAPIGVQYFAARDNMLGMQVDSSETLLSVRNDDTVFQAGKSKSKLPPLSRRRVLDDNDFSVKMHVKFFEWLHLGRSNGQTLGLEGLLDAQTGGNPKAKQAFRKGASALDAVLAPDPRVRLDWSESEWKSYLPKRRAEFAAALNTAKSEFRGNPVGFSNFPKFWEFFLPDAFLKSPMGYLKYGF